MPPRGIPQDPEIDKLSVSLPLSDIDPSSGGREAACQGVMRAIRHAAIFETTPILERRPPMGLAMHRPEWH